MIPSQIFGIWARGLLSVVLLVLGPVLLYQWYQHAHVLREVADANPPATTPSTTMPPTTATSETSAAMRQGSPATGRVRVFAPNWGFNRQTALLVAGLAATLWAVPKGPLVGRRLLRRPGTDEPRSERTGEVRTLVRPDGSRLRVEAYGPADGPPVVLTHGWGLDANEWYYLRKELAGCRVIAWDLPGLGESTRPTDHDYSLENLARDLDAVIGVAGGTPVVLVGHSIGGMISLTHCKVFPEAMGARVAGLGLINTTYTNPVRTTTLAALKSAIQKPLLEPLLRLTIPLSPLVRAMNRLSYWNGSAHRSSEKSGFSGRETRGQLDFVAAYTPRSSPAVLARGMLGMLRYDATDVLRSIRVPVLVVAGDKDPVCKPDASGRMASEIPGAELLTLAPARHEGLIEHHAALSEAVRPFVLRCATSAAVPRRPFYPTVPV